MKMRIVVAVVALLSAMVCHCLAEGLGETSQVRLFVLGAGPNVVVPGAPVRIQATLTNGSERSILDPPRSYRTLVVQDPEGRALIDNDAHAHDWTYYSPPRPGEKTSYPRMLPGQSKTWQWDLRLRFNIVRPGRYTFYCTVRSVFLPHEENVDWAVINESDRFVVQAEPFEFVVSEEPLFWKQKRTLESSPITKETLTEIAFQAAEFGEDLSLSFYVVYRHPRGESYGLFHQLGKLKSKGVLPEIKEYGAGRFGVRYVSPDGEKCALVRYNRSGINWVLLDLPGEGHWPAWPDEEAWRKLKAGGGRQPAEQTGTSGSRSR